jgi:hypothetical protein
LPILLWKWDFPAYLPTRSPMIDLSPRNRGL